MAGNRTVRSRVMGLKSRPLHSGSYGQDAKSEPSIRPTERNALPRVDVVSQATYVRER